MIEDKIFVKSGFLQKKKKRKKKWKVFFLTLADTFVGGSGLCWGSGRSPEKFFFSCTKSIKFITAYKAPNKI